jgi:hypothetical protein
MKPVASNTQIEEGCTKTSSNCVIWQGPDLPCINLCSGDSVTDVIYALAEKLCEINDNMIDITGVDVTCLLTGTESAPVSVEDLFQLIINKTCESLACCNTTTDPGTPVYYTLPACLQYVTPDGSLITTVELTEYLNLMAAAVCDIYLTISNLQTKIDNLDARVTALEFASTTTGGTINITTQCASGPTPGVALPVQLAFYNFESKFCALTALLGTTAELNSFITQQCTDLDAAPQLADPTNTMAEIPGWVSTPTTVAQNLSNIWLVLCDLRAAVASCCTIPPLACAPLPVTDVTISTVTTTSATASWTTPAYGSGEAPVEYSVKIYATGTGGGITGSALYTTMVAAPATSIVLPTSTYEAGKPYAIVVTAVYASCGESAVSTATGEIHIAAASLCLKVVDSVLPSTSATCSGTSYTVFNKRTTVLLVNSATGLAVVNSGVAITVTVKYERNDYCSTITYPTHDIVIPNGASSGSYDYQSTTKAYCPDSVACLNIVTTYSCVDSVTGSTSPLCIGTVSCSV